MYNLRTLDNGIRLLTTFVPHAMSVSTCIYVESGSRHEEDVGAVGNASDGPRLDGRWADFLV